MSKIDVFLDNAIDMLELNSKFYINSRIIRVESFNLIQETLEKHTKESTYKILKKLGKIKAELMIKKMFSNKVSYEELINQSISFGSKHKLFNLTSLKFNKNITNLKFNYTFQSKLHSKSNKCVCSFIEGFFEKTANSSKEKYECICREIKCIAKGDDYCEFEIKKQ